MVSETPKESDPRERRKATLESLVELSDDASEPSCFSPEHANALLRRQSSAAELRELGVTEERIAKIFGDSTRSPDPNEEGSGRIGHFRVRVEARFEAAHFLRAYRGITEPLHGHSYRVTAELAPLSGELDEDELAVDFIAARDALRRIASKLDYTCINDVAPFDELNPTAENVAKWIADELEKEMDSAGGVVTELTLYEGPENAVVYRKGW